MRLRLGAALALGSIYLCTELVLAWGWALP